MVHLFRRTSSNHMPMLHSHKTEISQTTNTPSPYSEQASPVITAQRFIDAMIYLQDIAEGANSQSAGARNPSFDTDGFSGSDVDDFCSVSSAELEEEALLEPSELPPSDDEASTAPPAPSAFGLPPIEFAAISNSITNTAARNEGDEQPIPRSKSIAHHDIANNNIVYLSLDLETGGEYCGIIQLSGQLFRPNPADISGSDFIDVEDTFNSYVRPPDGVIKR